MPPKKKNDKEKPPPKKRGRKPNQNPTNQNLLQKKR